jgi:luciferase family oxidoreductase group 1
MNRRPLSVLETAPVAPGGTGYTALTDAIHVARTAEDLGYQRFWVAEHHFSKHGSATPAVLLGHLAAVTRRIRLGSGGVMLSNYAPLIVAEQFALLEGLQPGRIDLGIGSSTGAPHPNPVYDEALHRDPAAAGRYGADVDELRAYLAGDGLPLVPKVEPVPVYVLGTSEHGAAFAGGRGLPFVFGHHLGRGDVLAVPSRYRASATGDGTHLIVSVQVICAETDERADELAVRVGLLQQRRTEARELGPAIEDARLLDAPPTPRERFQARKMLSGGPSIVGGPDTVAAGLDALAERTGADELMVVPVEHDGAGRERTLRCLADVYRPRGGADVKTDLALSVA